MTKSRLRITFDPGGANELLLVDWLDPAPEVAELAWTQEISQPRYVEASWAGVRAHGGITRERVIQRVLDYASHEAAQADLLERDYALAAGVVSSLEIRVLDLSASAAGTVAERTASIYTAPAATLRSVSARPHSLRPRVTYTYRLALGQITESTLHAVEALAPAVWLRAGYGLVSLADSSIVEWQNQGAIDFSAGQETAASRPTATASPGGGLCPVCDGSADYLQGVFGQTLAQPILMVGAYKLATLPAATRYQLDGADATDRLVALHGSAGTWQFNAGSSVNTGDAADTAWHIHSLLFDGASSQYWLDGVSIVTGNPGAQDLAGLTLGARYDGTAPSDLTLAELLVIASPGGSDRAAIEAHLNAVHSIY